MKLNKIICTRELKVDNLYYLLRSCI